MTRVPASASFNLEGKVVIITGASKNIGAALAGAFAAAGSNLVLVARGAHDLRRIADQVQAEHGARVETVCADVTAREAPDRIAGTACGAFGDWRGLVRERRPTMVTGTAPTRQARPDKRTALGRWLAHRLGPRPRSAGCRLSLS
jgi:NAD(P)-dependent dehydrogenase (short-subunit alcohol dehydrogenase family)